MTQATLLLIHWPGTTSRHFGIESGTGQILTKDPLDYDAQGSYLVTVQVTDGADDGGAEDTSIDDTIEVTIRVSVTIDLSDWTAEDYETNTQYCASGTWTVDSNGRAKETRGQAPSILHGDFDAYGKRLTATVRPGNDDDFFGFVVGFNSGDSTNADANYLLIDWKKQSQSFDFGGDSTSSGGSAEVGLRLSRVTGVPDCDEFWQHANLDGTGESSGLGELQEADSKGSTRYSSQDYEFVIDFGSESIEVYLDGRLELDLDGEFSNGRFGAYAMLHNSAMFWDFSYTRWQLSLHHCSSGPTRQRHPLFQHIESRCGPHSHSRRPRRQHRQRDVAVGKLPESRTRDMDGHLRGQYSQLHSTAIRLREICFVPKSPTTTRRVQAGWPPAPLPPPRTSRGLSRSPQMRP